MPARGKLSLAGLTVAQRLLAIEALPASCIKLMVQLIDMPQTIVSYYMPTATNDDSFP
jgi:hypothetical protein